MLNLSDDMIMKVLNNLHTDDVVVFQATNNRRIMSIVHSYNDHMLTQFQVAMWRMQQQLNYFDARLYKNVPWPAYVIDLFVFAPFFEDQTSFVRNFLLIYCPLASLFEQTPPKQDTCYRLVQRMYALSEQQLTVETIVDFVNVGYASLEALKQLTKRETVQQPTRLCSLYRLMGELGPTEYPNLMQYIHGLDNMHDGRLFVRNLLALPSRDVHPPSISFVRRAIGRSRLFQVVMQNIDSLSLNCVSLKYITSGLLYKLPSLRRLKLELTTVNDLGPLITYLAATNQIKDLCIVGTRCVRDEEVDEETFVAFRKFTKLKRLSFHYCEFLTDRVLRGVTRNVANVHTFSSLYNPSITVQGMLQALSQEPQIRALEVNYFWIRVTHSSDPPTKVLKFFGYCLGAGVIYLLYLLFSWIKKSSNPYDRY